MNKKFLANTTWIVGGQIIKNILGFVVSIFTAKYLGPSNYGILGYITSITTFFTAVANLGLGNIIIKEILANKENEGKVVGTAITLQFISSSITYFLVVGIVIALNQNDKVMWVCAFLQSLTLIFSSFDHINYYYQSRYEAKYATIVTLIAYFLMQLYKIYLLATDKSVKWFAFATTLDYAIVAITLLIIYLSQKQPKLRFSNTIAKQLLKQSMPFILAGSISVIYASLDRIMLKELLDNTSVVGQYNTAYTISHVWTFVVAALITSFSPLIYQSAKEDGISSNIYKTRIRQMYFLVFWAGVAASVFVDIIAKWFILKAYGETYRDAIIPTMILTWASVFAYIGVARGIQFVCEEKQKYITVLAIFTVIINILMNFLLIPRYSVIGASIATLVSEIFVCIIAPLFFKKTRNISINILQAMFFKGINIKSLIGVFKNKFFKKKQTAIVENSQDNSQVNHSEQSDVAVDNQEKEIEIEIQQIVDDIDKDNDAEA